MYSVKYYKKTRDIPVLTKPYINSVLRPGEYTRKMMIYHHAQKRLDTCWNIKSLTIDIEDLKHAYYCYDEGLNHLFALFGRWYRNSSSFGEDLDSITIINSDSENMRYIYDILNCEWMINKDDALTNYEELLSEKQKKLNKLKKMYSSISDDPMKRGTKNRIAHKISLYEYCIQTLKSFKKEEQKPKVKSRELKLGRYFIIKDRNK